MAPPKGSKTPTKGAGAGRRPGRSAAPTTPAVPVVPSSSRAPPSSAPNPLPPQKKETVDISKLSLAPTRTQFPTSPGNGTIGIPIEATVNFFQMDIKDVPDIHEYACEISCQQPPMTDTDIQGRVRARAITLLLKDHDNFQQAASDYASKFVSIRRLFESGSTASYTVKYCEPEESGDYHYHTHAPVTKTFNFTLKYTRTYSSAYHQDPQNPVQELPEDHLATINILLARGASQDPNTITTARRQKFFNIAVNYQKPSLGRGLTMFSGYFRTVKLTSEGLALNLNTAASAVYTDGRLDEVFDLVIPRKNNRSLVAWERQSLSNFFRGVVIEHTYTGRPIRKSICGLAEVASGQPYATEVRFIKDGQSTTVDAYFTLTYPTVRRPNPAALVVNVGNQARPVYVPSDLCNVVVGQPYKKSLHASQTSEMIKHACRTPLQNKALIMGNGLACMDLEGANGPRDRFAIDIDPRMKRIPARILPHPTLEFGNSSFDEIIDGDWDMRDKAFHRPAPSQQLKLSWLEFFPRLTGSYQDLPMWLSRMRNHLGRYTGTRGVQMSTYPDVEHSQAMPEDGTFGSCLGPKLRQLFDKHVKLVLIILPNESIDNYATVKKLAETGGPGLHTVCVVRSRDKQLRVEKLKDSNSVFANLSLKINAKLGGNNVSLSIPDRLQRLFSHRLMFIGADVTHPGLDAMAKAPSVAAMVATTGPDYFKYPGMVTLQRNEDANKMSVEVIEHFGVMLRTRLRLYADLNEGKLPHVLIVYRDGVADGMFGLIADSEIAQMQQICRAHYPAGQTPKIVFIVVQKRHSTRFYVPDGGKQFPRGFDAHGNIRPGFVVDQQVVSPRHWDFYLASHRCLKGTSRSAHYVVLHDEFGLTSDEIQLLTYQSCFMFGRATKSISVHPAARYADLLCDRARMYLRSVYNPTVAHGQPWPTFVADPNVHWDGFLAHNVKNSMFYL